MSTKIKNRGLIKSGPIMKIFFILMFAILVLHSVLLIYPYIWLFLNSLKTSYEFYTSNTLLLPQKWIFANYKDVFSLFTDSAGNTYLSMTFNSIWWSVGNTVPAVFMCCVVAYVMAKFDFKAKNVIYGVIIFIMVIPIYGSSAAAYKQAHTLGLYDSPLYIIKSLGGYGGFQFLMLFSFFKSLPKEYMNAAEIDGAGYFTTFFKIMLPMAMGPIVALAVMSFVECWNNYMTLIIYLPSFPTLSAGLYIFEQKMANGSNVVIYYAGALMTVIPVVIIFTIFHDIFLNNVSFGGLKG